MPHGEITRLDDPHCAEVSVVTRGAQKQRFLLTKNEDVSIMEFEKLAKIMGEGELDNEKALDELLDGADDNVRNTVKAALRAFGSVADKVSEDVLGKLAKAAVGESFDDEPAVDDEPAPTDNTNDVEGEAVDKVELYKEDGSLNLEAVPEEMRPVVEALSKQVSEKAEKYSDLAKSHGELLHEVELKKCVEKAEREFGGIPDSPENLGALLKELNDLDPEVAAKVEGLFKAASQAIKKSALFNEIGSGQPAVAGSAWEEITLKAKDYAKENGVPLAKARAHVMKTEPELYSQYKAERRGR